MNDILTTCSKHICYQLTGGGKSKSKWKTLEHNGVVLPPVYTKTGVPLLYNGKKLVLGQQSEEYAMLFAKYTDTEHMQSKTFRKNFFKSWIPYIKSETPEYGSLIKSIDECDFSKMYEYLLEEKEKKMAMTKEQKELAKERKRQEEEYYMYAKVDGKQENLGNFRIEPPGIFMGRGCHPKHGTIKKRIQSTDITLNMSGFIDQTKSVSGERRNWNAVIEDRDSVWIASWKDEITGKTKYVWLSDKSEFKSQSDREKFDKARKLGKSIGKIRQRNAANLNSSDNRLKQLATALYFIDNLALRVGGEKGDDEADTVGVTSLRVEHITLSTDNMVKLDFLGKDSIRYVNKVQVDPIVYRNLGLFIIGKQKKQDLFDLVTNVSVNDYLKSLNTDSEFVLTAKIFRTYNASKLFQDELDKITERVKKSKQKLELNELLDAYNKANAKVAVLCNHQKNVSKGFSEAISKIDNKISEYKEKLKNCSTKDKVLRLKNKIKELKSKKELKLETKNVSLGTSKINYIDPRISLAFLELHGIPVEKIFTGTLRDKFSWAFDHKRNFVF